MSTTQTNQNEVETTSISSNPAAVNVGTGTGALQRYVEKKLGIKNDHGIEFQGAWLGDTNRLFSGGISNAELSTSNSVVLLNLTVDMEKLARLKGGLFSAQFLQENANNTNGAAGVVQGYNSLPDVPPFNRSELYALWYRQEFFDKKLYSSALPMKKYIGGGLTAFGLIGNRADDSMGIGAIISGLNPKSHTQASETMYQIYYQAKAVANIYLEPVLSYIPTPGDSDNLNPVWAGTIRAIVLF